MKNKKERAQALSDALDQLDDDVLRNAYDVDDAEKFHALGRSKAAKPEKTRTVTRFHLYTAVAACLVLAIGISMIVLENVPNFHLWGPDPLLNSVGTNPSTTLSTQPPDIGVAEIVDSGTCGDDLTWTLDEDGTLIISGTGAIDIYRNSDFTWWDKDSVKKIIIGPGVTSIGYLAFRDCTNLTSVTIPDSVTSIGMFAFAYCANLTNVTMGSAVTTIEQGAFNVCSSLNYITIPDSVISIENGAFEGCDNLWHVMYTGSEAQWKAIEIGEDNEPLLEAFRHNDYAGEEIMIAAMKFPASGKESVVLFVCPICADTLPVTIPQVTHEHNDACGIVCGTCGDDLTWTLDADGTLTISGTGPMADFIDMLWDDEVVKKIIIEPGVTSIGEFAFFGCSDLTNVVIPASVTSIGRVAFLRCENLYHVLYMGSKTQWDTIEIENGNAELRYAVLHYDCTGNEVVDADRRFCEICFAACAHTWDPGIRTQKPTCTEAGSIYYYCTLCNGTKTEAIPQLPHTYDNDDDTTCNICGHDRGDSGFPIWIPIVAIIAVGGIVALIVLKKKR